MRQEIGWWAGVAVLVFLAVAAIVNWWNMPAAWTGDLIALLAGVIALGVLGGFVSFSRRLSESTDRGDPVIGSMQLMIFKTGAPFSLLSGGIFSVVLYLILRSGYLSGELFPKFADGSPMPSLPIDWSKLLVWSFLAGFAERLVPDTLDRLVGQARISAQAIGQAQPGAPPAGTGTPGTAGTAGQAGGTPSAGQEQPPASDEIEQMLDKFGPTIEPSWHDAASDPNRGQFGGAAERDAWKLTAACQRDIDRPGVVIVKARVERTSADAKSQTVRFHLSTDFLINRLDVNVVDGAAELKFPTHYPFVVGAELFDPDGPKLELDLQSVFPSPEQV
jgi:hypothetical protein